MSRSRRMWCDKCFCLTLGSIGEGFAVPGSWAEPRRRALSMMVSSFHSYKDRSPEWAWMN